MDEVWAALIAGILLGAIFGIAFGFRFGQVTTDAEWRSRFVPPDHYPGEWVIRGDPTLMTWRATGKPAPWPPPPDDTDAAGA